MNRIPFCHLTKGHGGDSEHYWSTAGEICKPLQHILYETLIIKLLVLHFIQNYTSTSVSIFKQS